MVNDTCWYQPRPGNNCADDPDLSCTAVPSSDTAHTVRLPDVLRRCDIFLRSGEIRFRYFAWAEKTCSAAIRGFSLEREKTSSNYNIDPNYSLEKTRKPAPQLSRDPLPTSFLFLSQVTYVNKTGETVASVDVPVDRYIFFATEEAGVDVPIVNKKRMCRNGCCTTCAVKVLEGKVRAPRTFPIAVYTLQAASGSIIHAVTLPLEKHNISHSP